MQRATLQNDQRPLAGIKVLELGQLIAGPQAGCVLAYFGAEVIKVEPPGSGDGIRKWRKLDSTGTSYWWQSIARNKKSITVNLRTDKGRSVVKKLMAEVDVVLENFRPGTLEKWGMDPDVMNKTHPQLIFARVSGYGQTGPRASQPGYASACEAYGGFRYVNGFTDRPPVRPNLSLGDTLASMHAVIGVLLALFGRTSSGRGQVVDVSIFESVYNMMEGVVPEYSAEKVIREPSGSTLTGIVPTNTYLCSDDKYVVIGGNGDSIYKRLMTCAGRSDLADDERMADNAGRVKHETQIDKAIMEWTATITSSEVLNALTDAAVPCGPIYSVEDMFNDPHYRARGLFESVEYAGGELDVAAIHPRLSKTPGRTDRGGPDLGEHTAEVLKSYLGMSDEEFSELRAADVI